MRKSVKFPQIVFPWGQIPPGSVTWQTNSPRTNSPRFSAVADKFPLDKFPVQDFVWGQFVSLGICPQKPFDFVGGISSGGNLSASPPVHHQFCTSQFFCCKTFWIEWYILLSWCTSDKMWICKNIVYLLELSKSMAPNGPALAQADLCLFLGGQLQARTSYS